MSSNPIIDHLSDSVLLEIFDSFRHSLQHERNYERVWNSNKGWFKLAHVCRAWRQVVLTSSSRLHMRLLFTENKSVTGIATKRLPPLPIIVSYQSGCWTALIQKRMVSALSSPDRVCGIAFDVPTRVIPKELLPALNQPFPSLDSLDFNCAGLHDRDIPPPFLTVQPPHLRRLKLANDASEFSCHILSCATSLVDLTLSLDRIFNSPVETQLLSHLQDMPLLRRLKLELWGPLLPSDITPIRLHSPTRPKAVSLPNLNFLSFTGHITQLEALMSCLAAPSLQGLRIALGATRSGEGLLLAPQLSNFILNIAKPFSQSRAQLNTSSEGITFFMLTRAHPPFKLILNPPTSLEQLGHVFHATFARVKDVFITSPFSPMTVPPLAPHIRWREFLRAFKTAKTLRISPGREKAILDILQEGRGEFSLYLLPALEEIVLNATTYPNSPTQVDEEQRAAILGLFKPLVDQGKRKGRTVNVHWNTDRVHPKDFYDSDVDM